MADHRHVTLTPIPGEDRPIVPILARGDWIRNRMRSRSFTVIWAVLAASFAIPGMVFLAMSLRNAALASSLVVSAVFGIPTLLAARYAVGCARAGLLITSETVVIRNPSKTRQVPVAEIDGFVAGLQAPEGILERGNATPGVLLKLKNGATIQIWALAREGLVWNSPTNVTHWESTAKTLTELVHPAAGQLSR